MGRAAADRLFPADVHGEKARLNQVLLDAIPCVALLLRPDREVVLSNKAGKNARALPGTRCFETWGQRTEPCPWCLAPRALESGEAQRVEVEALGIVWDAYWIPLGPELYLHYAFDVTEQRKMEHRLSSLNQTFIGLGHDSDENIRLLTASCGELLEATCAIYNRLEGDLLVSAGQWQTPEDYDPVDRPEGHLCYDVIQRGEGGGVFVVRDLPKTPYCESDPNVALYGLKTYVGHPVTCSGEAVGSICVVYQDDAPFEEEDAKTLEVIAKAIGIEEERKRAGESLLAAHTELVKAYDHLSQARATALASEKLAAIGRLTAGVSHEILNPLNTITISLHMLLNNPEVSPEVAEDLRVLMEQARRITKISQDLLFFSRQRAPERRSVDINDTARRTLDLMAYELKLDNICVEPELTEGLPKVQADEDQLQQVVLNLLTNARDAMPEGGRLIVATREAPPLWRYEGVSVELRVEDTGVGIRPEHVDKIFEPFFTTKAEGKGTGMGLSICHGIIEAHGGRIWAENGPGGGAAFVIRLPLEQADCAASRPESPAASAVQGGKSAP